MEKCHKEKHSEKVEPSSHMETNLIHCGTHQNSLNALNTPLFQSSSFKFDSTNDAQYAFQNLSEEYIYTRIGNPTIRALEEKMTVLECGADSAICASGMAAISTVFLSLLVANDCIIGHKTVYGDTFALLNTILPRYNIKSKLIDLSNLEELKKNIDDSVKVIFFETPANPNMVIIDIEEVCKIAKEKNIKVVVDNTFATPYLTNPIKFGADIVIHSATKYICGHGDSVAGIVTGKDMDYMKQLKYKNLKQFGGCVSPFNAWLLLRGLKTLHVRMERHVANAEKIAKYLESHPKVSRVLYPGLEKSPGYEIAKKQMRGFGAMISFELKGSFEEAVKYVNSTKLITLAVSLGDCESLIQIPAAMTHSGYNQQQLEEFGLSKTMIRLSVGIEHCDDLIADLEQSFKQVYPQ